MSLPSLDAVLRTLTQSNNHIRVTIDINPPLARSLAVEPPETHVVQTPLGPVHTNNPQPPTTPAETDQCVALLQKAGVSLGQAIKLARLRSLDYCAGVVSHVANQAHVKDKPAYINYVATAGIPIHALGRSPKK